MLPEPDLKAENQRGAQDIASGGDNNDDDNQGGDMPSCRGRKFHSSARNLRVPWLQGRDKISIHTSCRTTSYATGTYLSICPATPVKIQQINRTD